MAPKCQLNPLTRPFSLNSQTNAYFADTSYYIALLDVSDEAHGRADAAMVRTSHTVTTDFVLLELASYFSSSAYRIAVAELFKTLRNHTDVPVVPATRGFLDRGMSLYESRPDKHWSLVDCISFRVMEELELSDALTTDHHFEQAGFTALLKR